MNCSLELLNESISDVFASMVVQWSRDQTVHEADWLIGANIIYPNSESLKEIEARGDQSALHERPIRQNKSGSAARQHEALALLQRR